jgi:hypothetical protein
LRARGGRRALAWEEILTRFEVRKLRAYGIELAFAARRAVSSPT